LNFEICSFPKSLATPRCGKSTTCIETSGKTREKPVHFPAARPPFPRRTRFPTHLFPPAPASWALPGTPASGPAPSSCRFLCLLRFIFPFWILDSKFWIQFPFPVSHIQNLLGVFTFNTHLPAHHTAGVGQRLSNLKFLFPRVFVAGLEKLGSFGNHFRSVRCLSSISTRLWPKAQRLPRPRFRGSTLGKRPKIIPNLEEVVTVIVVFNRIMIIAQCRPIQIDNDNVALHAFGCPQSQRDCGPKPNG